MNRNDRILSGRCCSPGSLESLDHCGADYIAPDVDCRSAAVEEPVHDEDQRDALYGKAHCLEDDDHCHQAGLGNRRRPAD